MRRFFRMHGNGSDKRVYKRYTVEGIHGNMLFATEVRVLNLSDGGAAIEADKRLNMGADYTLKLQNARTSVKLQGLVVWSNISHSRHTEKGDTVPIYHAGLQFTKMSEQQYEDLQKFLDKHKIAQKRRLSGLRFLIRGDHSAKVSYPFEYEVKTLSMGGMLIRSNQSFQERQTFDMEIFLDDHVSVNFAGRVTSCFEKLEDGNKLFDVGIAFENVDDSGMINLEEYLKML